MLADDTAESVKIAGIGAIVVDACPVPSWATLDVVLAALAVSEVV